MTKKKPTVEELEEIISGEEVAIQVMPDGSVRVADGEAQKLIPPKIHKLEDVLREVG